MTSYDLIWIPWFAKLPELAVLLRQTCARGLCFDFAFLRHGAEIGVFCPLPSGATLLESQRFFFKVPFLLLQMLGARESSLQKSYWRSTQCSGRSLAKCWNFHFFGGIRLHQAGRGQRGKSSDERPTSGHVDASLRTLGNKRTCGMCGCWSGGNMGQPTETIGNLGLRWCENVWEVVDINIIVLIVNISSYPRMAARCVKIAFWPVMSSLKICI